MRKLVGAIGAAIIVCVMAAAFVAYFVYHADKDTNIMYDGFGRRLSESPFFVRWFFGQERLWTGWLWTIGDMVIFWGGLFIGTFLACYGFQDSEK